jgi:hypothetical protein
VTRRRKYPRQPIPHVWRPCDIRMERDFLEFNDNGFRRALPGRIQYYADDIPITEEQAMLMYVLNATVQP